jgi:hypothetical protein
MDQNGLMAALSALAGVCQKPDQLQFLNFLATQPLDTVQTVLTQYASKIEVEKLPEIVAAEFPQFSPEQRAAMVAQATEAYNFLRPR